MQFKLCRGGKSQRAAGDALPHQDSVRVCDTRQVGCNTYLDHHYQGSAIVSLIFNASKYLALLSNRFHLKNVLQLFKYIETLFIRF